MIYIYSDVYTIIPPSPEEEEDEVNDTNEKDKERLFEITFC